MSLEEKQRHASSAEEEAEQIRIRKAMEWSMYDFKCEEYDRKHQGR